MTISEFDEFKNSVTKRGFTHVETFGGLLPLAEWKPYGAFSGDGIMEKYLGGFEWIDDNKARDIPIERNASGMLGIWTFATGNSLFLETTHPKVDQA